MLILRAAGSIYGAVAGWRRDWYARNPARRRRLQRPVISVGNLSVGGSGKTPIVAHVARLLVEHGELPVILSRGYARHRGRRGPTVVSDRSRVLADFDSAGDEPLMLARMLPGVPVVVGSSRFLSGRLAEEKLAATVHLLDDGFQHVQLERDVDLLAISQRDLDDTPLPAGRLREPLTGARTAHALAITANDDAEAEYVARTVGISTFFRVKRHLGVPRPIASDGPAMAPADGRVLAVAGIARPERFFRDLAANGWNVVETMSFRDHHRFTAHDLKLIEEAARSARATVLVTEKDAARLGAVSLGVPAASVPLTITIEPAAAFLKWLRDRLESRVPRSIL
ncbi:MAG: tetraacyldisaccharide 4'-kinase [Blastocatellia bacterium]|nr:MAG: tetraacyldisaccharide 4'-kinase [Blastocatellia bacterium]